MLHRYCRGFYESEVALGLPIVLRGFSELLNDRGIAKGLWDWTLLDVDSMCLFIILGCECKVLWFWPECIGVL